MLLYPLTFLWKFGITVEPLCLLPFWLKLLLTLSHLYKTCYVLLTFCDLAREVSVNSPKWFVSSWHNVSSTCQIVALTCHICQHFLLLLVNVNSYTSTSTINHLSLDFMKEISLRESTADVLFIKDIYSMKQQPKKKLRNI